MFRMPQCVGARVLILLSLLIGVQGAGGSGDLESKAPDAENEVDAGEDTTLSDLDPKRAEKLQEKRAVLKMESFANVLNTRSKKERGHNMRKAAKLEKDLIDDKKGPDVLRDIVSVMDASDEPVDNLIKEGVAITDEDFVHLERYELDNPNIVLQDVDDEKSVEEPGRNPRHTEEDIWPKENGEYVIRYCRGADITDSAWSKFKTAQQSLHEHCELLRFEEVPKNDACTLTVKGDGDGCSAPVGYRNGDNYINLKDGDWLSNLFTGTCATKGIAEHELLHALGQSHEHKRSDRPDHVSYYAHNVIDGNEHNFNPRADESVEENYDLGSIMHYGCKSFSKSYWSDTLRANRRRTWWDGYWGRSDCWTMGQRTGLSSADIQQLQQMYRCESRRRARQLQSTSVVV